MNHGRKFQSEAVYLHPFFMQLQASRYSACFYYKKLAGNMVMCWLYLFSRFPISVMSVTRVCYYYCFFFLIIRKWKSERPNKILGPNLGFGESKIGMSRQNRDTWQIWARIPVIIISILGNIVQGVQKLTLPF